MDVVGPGSAARFATSLAAGYHLDADVVVTCALGVTCDAWPVAQAAAAALRRTGSSPCSLGTPSVCDAVQVAATETHGGAATAALHDVLIDVAVAPVPDRVPVMSSRLTDLMTSLAGGENAEEVVEAVVGVVVLAMTLAPAQSPGSLVPPEDHVARVVTMSGGEDADPLSVMYEYSSSEVMNIGRTVEYAADAVEASKKPPNCDVQFDLITYLETNDSFSSFSTFTVDAQAGIYDLRWTVPGPHPSCAEPVVEFTGSLVAEATSNARSFIASKTIRSPLEQGTEVVTFDNTGAVVAVWWTIGKVDVDFDPGHGLIVIHNFAPPAGNYASDAMTTMTAYNGYVFDERSEPAIVTYASHCSKQGHDPSICEIEHT